MPTPKLIGRLTREFPTEPKTGSGKGRPLPDDLLRQATRRVEIMALVAAVLWTLAPALSHLALYLTNPSDPQLSIFTRVNLIAGGCVVLSLSMYAYLRTGRRDPERVMDLALLFMVAMTFAMGVLIHWAQPWFVPTSVEPMITWSGPIILMTAGIVPVRPWKMLVAGLIAASMDTIGMLIAGATGDYHYGPLHNAVLMHYPNFLMLGAAVTISHVMTRLGQQVTREREMGSYRLGELLGRGGMGEVYLATHRMLARPAAIKLIRQEVLAAGDAALAQTAVARFRREAEAAAKLRSPHTVELYDFGVTQEGTFYLVMELLEGQTLERMVRDQGPLHPARVIHILRQVCESLEEAHSYGLVHRDIKPANIHLGRLGLRGGLRQGARLRPGPQVRRAERGFADRRRRDDARHAGVHGAGDGERPHGGRQSRPLLARLRRVLPAHRPPGVRGRRAAADHPQAPAAGAGAALARHRSADSSRARRAGVGVPREASGGPPTQRRSGLPATRPGGARAWRRRRSYLRQ